eukprot:3066188-Rhodomonas_salina.3
MLLPGAEFWNAGAVSWAGVRWSRAANASSSDPITGFFDIDSGYSLADNADHAVVVTDAAGQSLGCGLIQYYPAVTGFVHVIVGEETVQLKGNVAGLSAVPCGTFGAPCKLAVGDAQSCGVVGGGRYAETSLADGKHVQLVTPPGGRTGSGAEGLSGGAAFDRVIAPLTWAEGSQILVLAANGELGSNAPSSITKRPVFSNDWVDAPRMQRTVDKNAKMRVFVLVPDNFPDTHSLSLLNTRFLTSLACDAL